MVQASVYEGLLARFEGGEADVLPVLVAALREGVEGQRGYFTQVTTRATKRGGVAVPSEPVPNTYVLVVPGEAITLIGTQAESESTRQPDGTYTWRRVEKPYVRTYRLGDIAEYKSYNISFYGVIESIGERTVTISDDRKRARLDLFTFSWRNSRFDLAKARERNFEAMMNS